MCQIRKTLFTLIFCLICPEFASSQENADSVLEVYGQVPGLDPSPYYSVQVRELGSSPSSWLSPFTFLTECTSNKFCNTTGAFALLQGWSNSYVNFEMVDNVSVEVKITKLFGDPVTKAVVRPESSAVSCDIKDDGDTYIVINKPTLFTVDINGQMDDQYTGRDPTTGDIYQGPPIHTITIFANPFISKPSQDDPGVHLVHPGDEAPIDGEWRTLFFMPGVHDVGLDFMIQANRSYYIPGDALVYGTFTGDVTEHGDNIHIYGHGTISSDKIPHPDFSDRPPEDEVKFKSIVIKNPYNVLIEGITLANPAFHTINLGIGYKADHPDSVIRWVKILGWRANGDGVGSAGNQVVEDCFLRTQDDSSYVGGRGMRRIVYWQDSNGSSFVLSHIGKNAMSNDPENPLIIEDCTVIYTRSKLKHVAGGSVFNMRGEGEGSGGI